MANKKITELNEASSITSADWLVMVDTGNDETKKIHPDLVGASIPIQDTEPASPEENDLWIDTSEPEEMQEAIVNEYSESTSETYSCDYVNDLQTYSTTEKRVGTWIDGEPIYRKVFNFGAMPNTTTLDIQHNISNLGTTIKCYGMAVRSSDSRALTIPDSTPSVEINCGVTNTSVYVTTANDRSSFNNSFIVIEYTKATD